MLCTGTKARGQKIPYQLVVGPKEAETKEVSVRLHTDDGDVKKVVKVEELIKIAKEKIANKDIDSNF